jgi:glycosyltransferase involved in cell wall biosynthesis
MKGEYNGVEYLPYYHFNLKDSFNILIGWRNPAMFMQDFKAKKKLLWLHDIAYAEQFSPKVYENVDKIMFLSKWHRSNLPECPEEKVFITNNGINPKDFENLPEKRPNSLIWSSSYDRGLLPFIKNILPLIKAEIPDVTLDACYGWQNILKEQHVPHLRELYQELAPILENTPGITHHGRLPHKKLAQLMGASMVYPYASEFGETNNITSQKMQAAGVSVITTTQSGGTSERVMFGMVVPGNGIYTDKELQKDFAKAVIQDLKEDQSKFHKASRQNILDAFSWEKTASDWEKYLLNS